MTSILVRNGSTVPPELLGSVPRDVRLTGAGIALAAVGIALVVGALATAIGMSLAYARLDAERQLRDSAGISDLAEVTQVAIQRGEHPRRVVTYRYDVDRRSYTGRATLRDSDRRHLVRGARLAIEYLPSHPEDSWVAGARPSVFPIVLIPLVVLSLLVGAGVVAYGLRRQWILLSEGRVALARVTATQKVRSDKGRRYKVSYEFQTLSGARRTSRCDVGRTPPAIGSAIPVIYHRDQPGWSAIYPLQLVRPARSVVRRMP